VTHEHEFINFGLQALKKFIRFSYTYYDRQQERMKAKKQKISKIRQTTNHLGDHSLGPKDQLGGGIFGVLI